MNLKEFLQSKMTDVKAGKSTANFVDLGKHINLNWENRLLPGGVWSLDVGSLNILEDSKYANQWFKKKYPGKTLKQVNKTRIAKEFVEHVLKQVPSDNPIELKGHALQSQNKPGTAFGEGASGARKNTLYQRWWGNEPGFRTLPNGSLIYEPKLSKPTGGTVAKGKYKQFKGTWDEYRKAAEAFLRKHKSNPKITLTDFYKEQGQLDGRLLKNKAGKGAYDIQEKFKTVGDTSSVKRTANVSKKTLTFDETIDFYKRQNIPNWKERAAFDYINDVQTRKAVKSRVKDANVKLKEFGTPKSQLLSYEHLGPISDPIRGGFEHRTNIAEVTAGPNYAKSDFLPNRSTFQIQKVPTTRSSALRIAAERTPLADDATRFGAMYQDATSGTVPRAGKRLKKLEALSILGKAGRTLQKTTAGKLVSKASKQIGKFIPGVSTAITSTQATQAMQLAVRNPTFANKAFAAARALEAGLDGAGLAAQASLIGAPVGFAAEIGSLLVGFGTDAAQAIHSNWNNARGIQGSGDDLLPTKKPTPEPVTLKPRPRLPRNSINRIVGVATDVL